MAEPVFLDFETCSEADLKKAGAAKYARDPSTRILVACFSFGLKGPILKWRPGDDSPVSLLKHVRDGHPLVGHNIAGFELPIWNHVGVRDHGWPELKIEQLICTMTLAHTMSISASLEKAAACLGVEAQKDLQGARIMMQLCKPRGFTDYGVATWYERKDYPEKYEKLEDYCAQDVEVTRQIFPRFISQSALERAVWEMDYRINERGVRTAAKELKEAIGITEVEKKRYNARIQKLTKGFLSTVNETGGFRKWIESRGVADVPSIAKADVVELLSREDIPKDVREALLLRQEAAKSSTAKLESMLSSTCSDGRIRGIFQYHGAGTGRWAGRRIQPQNFTRGKLSPQQVEEIFAILGRIE